MKTLKYLCSTILLMPLISCNNLSEISSDNLLFIAANLPTIVSCSTSSTLCLNATVKAYEAESYCLNSEYTKIKTRCSDLSAGKCSYSNLGYTIVAYYGTDFSAETGQANCDSLGGVFATE
jgi:hypothetical protein